MHCNRDATNLTVEGNLHELPAVNGCQGKLKGRWLVLPTADVKLATLLRDQYGEHQRGSEHCVVHRLPKNITVLGRPQHDLYVCRTYAAERVLLGETGGLQRGSVRSQEDEVAGRGVEADVVQRLVG